MSLLLGVVEVRVLLAFMFNSKAATPLYFQLSSPVDQHFLLWQQQRCVNNELPAGLLA